MCSMYDVLSTCIFYSTTIYYNLAAAELYPTFAEHSGKKKVYFYLKKVKAKNHILIIENELKP